MNNIDKLNSIKKILGVDSISSELIESIRMSLLKDIAKDNFPAFCEYCIPDTEKTNTNIKLQPIHREWCELIAKHDKLVLFSPMEFGKCLAQYTNITMIDGRRKYLKNINPGDIIFSMNDRFKIVPTKVVTKECTGNKELLEITTKTGRNISVSPDHRFYIFDEGWIPASRLKVGDRIATSRILPIDSPKPKEIDYRIELLGFLLSEGSLTKGTPRITHTDIDVIRRLKYLSQKIGYRLSESKHSNKNAKIFGFCITDSFHPINWLKSISLHGCNSYTKFIPSCVFKASEEEKKLFISALFSGDGTTNKTYRFIEYSSVSKQLIYDLQELLLHFGIISSVSSRYTSCNGKKFLSYRLTICSKDSIIKFRNTIKYLYPKYKHDKLLNYEWNNQPGCQLDGIPIAWTKYLYNTDHWLRNICDIRVNNNPEISSRETVYNIWGADNDESQLFLFDKQDILYDLATSDILWDRIESIKDIGTDLTYDLQTEQGNYVANNIVTHNSTIITQSYPIWLLGRNPDERIIIVSATYDQACKFLSWIREHILSNERIHEVFPKLKPAKDPIRINSPMKWSEDAIIVERNKKMKEFSIQAMGVEGPLLNVRISRLILDDVINLKNSASKRWREKIITWFDSTAINRLLDDGQCIVVGTSWSNTDLPHYLESKTDWTTVKYSVEKEDENIGYRWTSWPERWTPERLEERRIHNPTEYDRTMRNIAKTGDQYPFSGKTEELIGKVEIDSSYRIIVGMDLSTKTRPGTSIIVIGYSDKDDRKVVIEVDVGAWNATQKEQKLIHYYDKYNPLIMVVESNSLQDDLVDIYKGFKGGNGKNLPIQKQDTRESNKNLWIFEFERELDNQEWIFSDKKSDAMDRLIDEIEYYPDYETSDCFMSLLLANSFTPKNRSTDRVRATIIGKDDNKLRFGFNDYVIFHRKMQREGYDVDMPENYKNIVDWIRRNTKYNNSPPTVPSHISESDFMAVYNDMVEFVDELNGDSKQIR